VSILTVSGGTDIQMLFAARRESSAGNISSEGNAECCRLLLFDEI
jgi:hypothetical protein